MNNEDFFRDLHKKFKKDYVLKEFVNPKEVDEYQCYFKLIIDSNRTEAGLEDILVFIRGINGVTIVRTGETTKRNEAGKYSTRLQVKYTPQTEWIERKGILVWIAEVFTSLGAGLYLVSLFYSLIDMPDKIIDISAGLTVINMPPASLWGMALAWIIIIWVLIRC